MAFGVSRLIGLGTDARAPDHWKRLSDLAGSRYLSGLEAARARAIELRRHFDPFCRSADRRMAAVDPGEMAIVAPREADWLWRPACWRLAVNPPAHTTFPSGTRLAEGLKLFHDCRVSEPTLRQIQNRGATATARFGVRMDVFRFDGSFLSLVLDLPGALTNGLGKCHVVGLSLDLSMERQLEIFARLNVRHGPNTEQIVRAIALGTDDARVEFDLAYSDMNPRRVERAWLDLIFKGPEMNRIEIRDLTMYRRPRAEI